MAEKLYNKGVKLLGVYLCPHHWEEDCDCRKPKAGLFNRVAEEHLLRMDRTLYIGDDIRDRHAAFNAGCGSALIASNVECESAEKSSNWAVNADKLSDVISDIKTYMGRYT
jgi:HAD superfamily hydrolase (TIGR01662 family)